MVEQLEIIEQTFKQGEKGKKLKKEEKIGE
jgi:hypothetical protein